MVRDKVATGVTPPKAPITGIERLAHSAESQRTRLVSYLGHLSLGQMDVESLQDWDENLTTAADKLANEAGLIRDLVAGISADIATAINEARADTSDSHIDYIAEVTTRLGLSLNEKLGVGNALGYLRQFPESRHNQRRLMIAAFGKILPKEEANRFNSIFSGYANYGLVEQYGRAYRYVDIDSFTPIEVQRGLLDEEDAGLIKYIRDTAGADGKVNIGRIIREYIGVEELDPEDFSVLVDKLNTHAHTGYLTHDGGAWYGRGEVQPPEELKLSTRHIMSPALSSTNIKPYVLEPPVHRRASEKANELSPFVPDIIKYAKSKGPFRMEELRRDVPSVAALSDEEYAEFKLSFGAIRADVLTGLRSQGTKAQWAIEGRRRGQKYDLVIGSSEENKTNNAPKTYRMLGKAALANLGLSSREVKMTQQLFSQFPDGQLFKRRQVKFRGISFANEGARDQAITKLMNTLREHGLAEPFGERGGREWMLLAKNLGQITLKMSEVLPPPLTPSQQRLQAIKNARFAQNIVDHIDKLLSSNPAGKERLTVVKKDLAAQLEIPITQSGQIISSLIEKGHYHKNGSERGYKILATQASEAAKSATNSTERKRNKQWTDTDTAVLTALLNELGNQVYLQQGIDLTKFAKNSVAIKQLHGGSSRVTYVARIAERAKVLTIHHVKRTTGSVRSKKLPKAIATITKEQKTLISKDPQSVIDTVLEHFKTNEV